MNELTLRLSETEGRALYQWIHRTPGGQDLFVEAYRQLQSHFFNSMTVEELTQLLGGES